MVFQRSYTLPDSGWARDQILEGSWISDREISHGTLILGISHTPEFGYQNLYLSGKINKGDQIVWSDTFSIQLAQSNIGQWMGEEQQNGFVVTDTIPYKISLENGEALNFEFAQFSRENMLQGVDEVEVQIMDN